MSRQTEDSRFPSTMNLQDLLDMSNAIPEECATCLPKSNAHRTLAGSNRAPANPPTTTTAGANTTSINYEDSILSKMASLLKTNALADVSLIVGEQKVFFHAHKLILGLASPVFTAMFYGGLANSQEMSSITRPNFPQPVLETNQQTNSPSLLRPPENHHNILGGSSSSDPSSSVPSAPSSTWQAATVVEIPDCTPQAMRAFLQYIYTNGTSDHSASISVDDALSLLYTARKYAVHGLEDKCVVTLSSSITADNVFDILFAANFYNIASLDYLCWEFIEDNPVDVLNSHLSYLTHDTIQSILKNDKLNCKEVELFEVLMRWVEQECSKMNLDPIPENIRRLCATELKMIRFPIMSGPEFADTVVPTGVLTVEQIAQIFTAINTSESRKKEQQDPNFPSRSSVLLNGLEFSSQKRVPNKKPTPNDKGQTHDANLGDEEGPPVFTFIAEQQIRNRDQQQDQNQRQIHQQPVNAGSNNVANAGGTIQELENPFVIALGPHLAVPNNNALANNHVAVVEFDLPGVVGGVPVTMPIPVTQAGAGERGRSRQRQRRNRRRSGSNSSENQPSHPH